MAPLMEVVSCPIKASFDTFSIWSCYRASPSGMCEHLASFSLADKDLTRNFLLGTEFRHFQWKYWRRWQRYNHRRYISVNIWPCFDYCTNAQLYDNYVVESAVVAKTTMWERSPMEESWCVTIPIATMAMTISRMSMTIAGVAMVWPWPKPTWPWSWPWPTWPNSWHSWPFRTTVCVPWHKVWVWRFVFDRIKIFHKTSLCALHPRPVKCAMCWGGKVSAGLLGKEPFFDHNVVSIIGVHFVYNTS